MNDADIERDARGMMSQPTSEEAKELIGRVARKELTNMSNNGDLKDVKLCPMVHTHFGSPDQVVVAGVMGPFTVFCECGVRGPYKVTRELAVDAWNSMPRAFQDDKWIRWEDRVPVKGEAGYVIFRDDLNGRVWIQEGTTVTGEWWHHVALAWLPRPALPFWAEA